MATVATKDHIFETTIENPTNVPYTLTLVWSKEENTLKAYLNGDLISVGTVSNNTALSNIHYFNEYLLVFADYYNNQSDLQGILSTIKMWSVPLSVDEISQLIKESLLGKHLMMSFIMTILNV